MTHWQNFYHDASAEELDTFSIEQDYRSFATLAECNEFFDRISALVLRARALGYLVAKYESVLQLTTTWRFSRP